MAHFLNPGRVEAVGRFVQDQQFRISQDCHGDTEPLLHSERVVAEFFIALVIETNGFQSGGDFCLIDPFQLLYDLHVLKTGQVSVSARIFNQAPCLAKNGQSVCGIHDLSKEFDAALTRMDQPENHLERGTFACSVWPEKAIDAFFWNSHGKIVYAVGFTALFTQMVRFQDVIHRVLSSLVVL